MQKKIGLIGCGNWGKNILRDLIKLNCHVYVVDINPEIVIEAKALGAFKSFLNIDELPDCDGYVVAVPIPDLKVVCAELLNFKKPIFSEKTLCLSLEDYFFLKNKGGTDYIFAMHKWHYHPGIEMLGKIYKSGIVGELEELHAVRHAWVEDFHGGDVFWTQAIHDMTIIQCILGYIPDKVRCINTIKNNFGVPVSFNAMIGEKPTVVVSVSGNHCSKRSGVSIHGKKGSAELHNALDKFVTIKTNQKEEKVEIDTTFPLFLELKEFVEYLNGSQKPRCDLESAFQATKAILRLREYAGL